MSRAGAQAVVLPTAAPCRWPCRPSAWASRLFIGFWSIWSCAPRRSSNGSHWVLSILGFSPRTWAAAAARRLGDNAVQVREAGFTCRASPPYGKQCSLSRSSFRSVNMKKGAKAPRDERTDHHRESHTLWFNAPLADAQRRPPLTRQRVVAEALTVIAQDGVEALEGHPGVAGLLQLRDPLGPHSLAVAEAFLAPLQTAGFGDHQAGLAFFLIVDYTTGFAVSSPPISTNQQRVRDQATRNQLHQFFRSLPADRFPALVALGPHVWVDNRDERFTAGLDVLVDGLKRARHAPRQPTLAELQSMAGSSPAPDR